MKISQSTYKAHFAASDAGLRKALSDASTAALVKAARKLPPSERNLGNPLFRKAALALAKAGFQKAGVTSSLGYNFYDLRGPAALLFPVNTPLINSIPRLGRVNDGTGTAAHWKATRNPNATNVYAGVAEGQRNALSTPDENDYIATYKELGIERGVTFTAEFAGEGFTDNLGDEHLRGLLTCQLAREGMALMGNSGTAAGNNGLALGTCATPVTALKSGGAIATSTDITVFCVALTAMGLNHGGQAGYGAPPSVTNGLVPSYTRTNFDGSTLVVAGGTSAISAASNTVITTSGNQQATATVPAVKGACGYAWYVSGNGTPTTANAFLYAITNAPVVTITSIPSGTQAANSAGLNADNSFQATDYDGLLTYAFTKGLWTDMGGGTFTALNNGQVQEIETDLESLFVNFQAPVDTIWCSADVKRQLQAAILSNSGGVGAYRFGYEHDSQNRLAGGFVVDSYLSSFSMKPDGSDAIPLRIHPMLPPGTLLYDISSNPYPHSRLPGVRAFLVQRDLYSIEWPLVTREWTFGTYVHEVLAHYVPWITGVRTGIGSGS